MALVAWYPLISNMNNQGVGNTDLTVTSTPTFVSGLIGGALQGGGAAKWTATQTANVLNNTAMSFAFWVYPDAGTGNTSARARFFGNDSPRHYSIFQYPTCNDLHWDWRNNAGSTVLGGVLSGVLPSYKWTHVCITYQNPSFKIYINGQREYSTSGGVLDVQNYANETPVILACAGRKLCDYRIYNHCLSPKEVEILARGLVLHYPMTGGDRGQENLYDFETVASKWTNEGMTSLTTYSDATFGNVLKFTNTSANVRIYRNVSNVWTTATTYTVSFMAKAATAGTIINMSRSLNNFSPNFTLTTDWKKYSGQISNTTSTTGGTLSVRTVSGTGEVYLTNIKLELGNTPTTYIPGVGDSHYTSMGYNNNTEYDVSGYLHNATCTNTSYSSDAARYPVSTVFNKTAYLDVSALTIDMTQVTFAVWFKITSAQTWSRIFDFGSAEGGGYCFGLATGNNGTTLVVYGRRGSSGASLPDKTIQTISLNTWYHAVITLSGTTCKCYVNGTLVISYEITSAYPNSVAFALRYLGKSVFSADKLFDGNISDFRIYGTALNANDVAELYNTALSLSNNGALLGYEFVET